MVARITTVAFQGIEVVPVDVQIQMTTGSPVFGIVGLPDKAVGESRERVRAALHAIGLSLPLKRIIVNLSPADLQKEGNHYDLPIALVLLSAMRVLPSEDMSQTTALGELALDSTLTRVSGILPTAVDAASRGHKLICPEICGGEAAWAGDVAILAAPNLLSLVNHYKGTQVLSPPTPQTPPPSTSLVDLRDVKGQETAKRALEVAAAGGHNLLMSGPPGTGKSMLAARLPSILPALSPAEALEVTMIHSIAGTLGKKTLIQDRPFRDPHHSSSTASLVGGGLRVKPGEVSLAHKGVLFLDELPEFQRVTLEALRQPLEAGRVTIARANAHMTYPSSFQFVAAMNPCQCGYIDDPKRQCARVPQCARAYQSKVSGPLFDRIDLHIDVPRVRAVDLAVQEAGEASASVAARVTKARNIQTQRYKNASKPMCNADIDGQALLEVATPDAEGKQILEKACERFNLSARGYYRILKLARTLADMEEAIDIRAPHVLEALNYRRQVTPITNETMGF